jgi:hypothetical protein
MWVSHKCCFLHKYWTIVQGPARGSHTDAAGSCTSTALMYRVLHRYNTFSASCLQAAASWNSLLQYTKGGDCMRGCSKRSTSPTGLHQVEQRGFFGGCLLIESNADSDCNEDTNVVAKLQSLSYKDVLLEYKVMICEVGLLE